MIPWALILKNGKLLLYLAVGAAIMLAYNKYTNAIEKIDRLEKNAASEVKKDSVGYSEQNLTEDEAEEKIYYTDPYLAKLIKDQGLKIKNLQQVITTQNEFFIKDTTKYVLNEILKGIQENKIASQRVVSSDSCYLVGANIHFDGEDIYMNEIEVRFMTRTDIIASVKRRKWYLPWKWFKKRKVTVSVTDKCGKSTTELVNLVKE